jgi:multidrug efflux pump subunit AcrB
MLVSLAAAFIVTPWAAARLLRPTDDHRRTADGVATRLYRRAMGALIGRRRARIAFLAGVLVLLLASLALVPLKLVTVKMLPFDNKSEFQVIVDMPEGTALEQTTPSSTCRATSARRRRRRSTVWCVTTSCGAHRIWPICT